MLNNYVILILSAVKKQKKEWLLLTLYWGASKPPSSCFLMVPLFRMKSLQPLSAQIRSKKMKWPQFISNFLKVGQSTLEKAISQLRIFTHSRTILASSAFCPDSAGSWWFLPQKQQERRKQDKCESPNWKSQVIRAADVRIQTGN